MTGSALELRQQQQQQKMHSKHAAHFSLQMHVRANCGDIGSGSACVGVRAGRVRAPVACRPSSGAAHRERGQQQRVCDETPRYS